MSEGFHSFKEALEYEKKIIRAAGNGRLEYIHVSYNGIIGKWIVNWKVR